MGVLSKTFGFPKLPHVVERITGLEYNEAGRAVLVFYQFVPNRVKL
jgi:hypothetical protein